MGDLILLLGGARSGKSTTALRMAAERGGDSVLFIATATASDEEMAARIAQHQAERPAAWQTLEAPRDIGTAVACLSAQPRVIVVDCITLLAANALLSLPEDCTQAQANAAILAEIDSLLAAQHTSPATWIVVSNEVGMGIVPPYRLGRLYRDALGSANQRLAAAAAEVYLMVAGLAWRLK
ncbi:MAG: bifunctional adenosylcobinamide kinase/adenosylcobinamide-phosphate guanylyltransferase [Candidatus Thermofonsia Clade 1 bacterium]|uniref:Adenosylcobinamide kinase n=1 Tax=Candidatus Thermofonsia Clade 1 bacterium TaxID=2364210 RepID=A0A2M8NYJ4_9CHLR|nr:MAG: bifunctional adenosylcobinamide kinase/adenosylcobinamide-phosphate guanylyltransferase [Candidatus Thermofonsia Clade 1 bacterium]